MLSDAITCPIRLEEWGWDSFGDTDPDVAHEARRQLWRELQGPSTYGVAGRG